MTIIMRKIITIDDELCNGCGQCVSGCAEGALQIIDGKAKLVADKYCDGLGACLGECPTGALRVIERAAEDFDEQAVEAYLAARQTLKPEPPPKFSGCPSARMQTFSTPCQAANHPKGLQSGLSGAALTHWPIQIRLVPPTAPFLKNADLVVAADCVPAACANFHSEILAQGNAVMIGCPKFDDVDGYIRKFAEIFTHAELNSLTLAIMEVPCCGGMRQIIKEAMKQAGVTIPVKEMVVGVRGGIEVKA